MMYYNRTVFEQFRNMAVTDPAQISVGSIYWSNHWPEKFQVVKVYTQREYMLARIGQGINYTVEELLRADAVNPRWILAVNLSDPPMLEGNEPVEWHSLWDNNCGNSYNPWLIFDSEETAKLCQAQLVVEWDNSQNF